jgi:hypothetical protein
MYICTCNYERRGQLQYRRAHLQLNIQREIAYLMVYICTIEHSACNCGGRQFANDDNVSLDLTVINRHMESIYAAKIQNI